MGRAIGLIIPKGFLTYQHINTTHQTLLYVRPQDSEHESGQRQQDDIPGKLLSHSPSLCCTWLHPCSRMQMWEVQYNAICLEEFDNQGNSSDFLRSIEFIRSYFFLSGMRWSKNQIWYMICALKYTNFWCWSIIDTHRFCAYSVSRRL